MKPSKLMFVVAATAALIFGLATNPALSQGKGKNGTTLAASKTIDICEVEEGTWRYSGEISVWNEGAVDTSGLAIRDCIQNKVGDGQFQDQYCTTDFDPAVSEIPAGTTKETATVFKYEIEDAPLEGFIRNSVTVTILNHSGSLGTPKGPNPKATWLGEVQGCETACGCTYTQGYWGSKPGVVWPSPFDRSALFFNSGLTWQQLLDQAPQGNGYRILAKQYIAAVLNQANNACVPQGVQDILDMAETFFQGASTPASACPLANSCGLQKTWGGILDSYNNGDYPGGPEHCGDE